MNLLIGITLGFVGLSIGADPVEKPFVQPSIHRIEVGGEGGWDYLSVDSDNKRLYVSRGNRVIVIDLVTEKVVGELANTPGVHGVAIVSELGKGFTSNGSDSTLTVFDLKSLKPTGKIEARGVPDAILYDPFSKRVFSFNHKTDDATVVDVVTEKVVGTIAFDAEPEAAVTDGKGRVFVNLRSTSEVAEIDTQSLKILNRWPLAPGVRPNGLGFDAKNRRLFSTCGNQKMVILDAVKGSVLGTAEIGKGSDGCAFDPSKQYAYSSNGDGSISVVGEKEPGQFATLGSIPTEPGARTMIIDSVTNRLYLSAAKMAPVAADAPPAQGRRNYVPGSFVIIVVE